MKPKPLVVLKNFTVPFWRMCIPFSVGATNRCLESAPQIPQARQSGKGNCPEGQMYFATSRRSRSTMERTGAFSMV
jgi:hypothetical protein